jgi:squalene-associated FAD-dependent desaturase
LAVVGGGLAGLAAAAAAVEQGLHVELFEARRRLGGRAGSYPDPETGELVDHCQHVWMGCCTNLADFCRRTGISDCFDPHRRLHFFAPDGRRCDFSACRWLPAPLHLLPAVLRMGYLSWPERIGLLRTLGILASRKTGAGAAADSPVGPWLRRQGESERALERFWSVVLQSALGESLDRTSLGAARKVLADGFLASRRACEVQLPRLPLGEIFDRRLSAWLAGRNVGLHTATPVRRIEGDIHGATGLVLGDGSLRPFDFYVIAVPWRAVGRLFSADLRTALAELAAARRIAAAPITAVHLWFDRPVTALAHAVLIGRLGQWVFNRSHSRPHAAESSGCGDQAPAEGEHCQMAPAGAERRFHYEVVISASHVLAGQSRADVAGRVCRELQDLWPAAAGARLLDWRVVTQPAAVFSAGPGVDALRPAQQTAVPNLFLAGDWTATGWPSTMESAVRSGRRAVEALLRALGRPATVLAPDLPRAPLARWLWGQ